MDLLDRIKNYENVHIVFWLIKDTCWMLELRWLGTIVMVPTLFVAIYIVLKTWHSNEVLINAAIFFWILANSYWMMIEFFNDNLYKHYAAIPFALGFVFVSVYYWKFFRLKKGFKRSEE
jgi:hypothetical protein